MAQIPEEIVEKVRESTDIVDVISGYLTLKPKGRNYFGLCPFHKEKTPSFSVNPDMQIFHCFGCGAGGNVFTFLMKIEGLTFPESIKLLAQQNGITIPESEEDTQYYRDKEALYYANAFAAKLYSETIQSDQAKAACEYLAKRGVSQEEFELFGIGYAPNKWDSLISLAKKKSIDLEILYKAGLLIRKENGDYYDRFRGRIAFYIKNLTGQVVGFGARRMIEDNSPKYINSPETDIYQKRFILYGLHQSRDFVRKEDEVIIVEGYTDYTSLWRCGVQNVVATSGTALTEDHARMLRRYTGNAVLLYDSDAAGANAAIRGADILLENGMEVKICTMPQGQDPDEFARSNPPETVRALIHNGIPLMEYKMRQVEADSNQSVSQRSQDTREILTTIAKVQDPIQQSFMVRDMSARLQINERAIWTEINGLQRKQFFKQKKEELIAIEQLDDFFRQPRGVAELGLIEVTLLHPEILEQIFKNLDIREIKHPEIRAFFQHFLEQGIDLLTFNPKEYITKISDSTIAKHLSQKLNEKNVHPKPWEFAKDSIIRFQLAKLAEHKKELKTEISAGEKQKQNISELKKELAFLTMEELKIRKGEYIREEENENSSDDSD